MTCIIGVSDGRSVTIAGDSIGITALSKSQGIIDKVFTVKNFVDEDTLIFGCTTSFRMIQILRYECMFDRNETGDSLEYLVTSVINTIRKAFKLHGYCEVKDGVESGGTFLIGYRGSLFYVAEDFQVQEVPNNKPAACGCGAEYALGAYSMLHKYANPDTVENNLRKSISAAAEFSVGVGGEIKTISCRY